jgi:hypothetical protein
MARRLHRVAKAADDNTVTSTSIMTTYVRRWEAGKIAPTERYRLHYCSALCIGPTEFGVGGTALQGEGTGKSVIQSETAGYVIVVIPWGSRRIVIEVTEHAVGARQAT